MARFSGFAAGLAIYSALIIAYVYSPVFFLIIFSFKQGTSITFPIQGFTTFWYTGQTITADEFGFLANPLILAALQNSIEVALVVTVIVTLVTILAALSLRNSYRGRDLIFYLIMLGAIFPGAVYAVGAFILYRIISLPLSLWTVVPVQVVYALPFGLILTLARFDRNIFTYEEAAKVLGAGSWRIFRKITYPLLSTQIIATALFAFTLSWGELVRSEFLEFGATTLPVYMFSLVQGRAYTPVLYVIGTLTTAVSLVLMISLALLVTRKGRELF